MILKGVTESSASSYKRHTGFIGGVQSSAQCIYRTYTSSGDKIHGKQKLSFLVFPIGFFTMKVSFCQTSTYFFGLHWQCCVSSSITSQKKTDATFTSFLFSFYN